MVLEKKNLFSAYNICIMHRRNELVFFLQFYSIYSSDLKLVVAEDDLSLRCGKKSNSPAT